MTILRPALDADPRLAAGFTTRTFAPVDEPLGDIRARLGTLEGFPQVASVGQVHGADVAVVTKGGHVGAHDGLVTRMPGVLLTVLSADCALVLLADADAGVVGACHAGWRGTVAGVVGKTVAAMRALGAEQIAAYVGPCISAEAFEVGDEVAAQFPTASVLRRPEWPRPHVDLSADLARQLTGAGVADVEVSRMCTVAGVDRFFSYRAEDGRTGRMLGFVGMRALAG